jgi:hypothetical protein
MTQRSLSLTGPVLRASQRVRVCLALCGVWCSFACQDPGCIRNSECTVGYECKVARCVLTADGRAGSTAGNAAGGGKGGSAASAGRAGSAGKAGSAGSAGRAGSAGKAGVGAAGSLATAGEVSSAGEGASGVGVEASGAGGEL